MHLDPETGKSAEKEGIEPKLGKEPIPKNDVVGAGVGEGVCGALDSKRTQMTKLLIDANVILNQVACIRICAAAAEATSA